MMSFVNDKIILIQLYLNGMNNIGVTLINCMGIDHNNDQAGTAVIWRIIRVSESVSFTLPQIPLWLCNTSSVSIDNIRPPTLRPKYPPSNL